MGGLILVIAIITFIAILTGRGGAPQSTVPPQPKAPEPPMYRKRSSIMNNSERAFFFELHKQLPPGYYVFPNMRIADMIDAISGRGFYYRRNKILPKHIDFLICDSYFKPVVALELNGASHHRPDRIERDELVRKIFEDAKLPLEFVNVGTGFAQVIERISATYLKNQYPIGLTSGLVEHQ